MAKASLCHHAKAHMSGAVSRLVRLQVRHSVAKFRRAMRQRPEFDRACYNLGTVFYAHACQLQHSSQQRLSSQLTQVALTPHAGQRRCHVPAHSKLCSRPVSCAWRQPELSLWVCNSIACPGIASPPWRHVSTWPDATQISGGAAASHADAVSDRHVHSGGHVRRT